MVCGHVGVQIGLAVLAVGTQGKPSGNEDLLSFLEVVDDAAPVTADLVVGRTLLLSEASLAATRNAMNSLPSFPVLISASATRLPIRSIFCNIVSLVLSVINWLLLRS